MTLNHTVAMFTGRTPMHFGVINHLMLSPHFAEAYRVHGELHNVNSIHRSTYDLVRRTFLTSVHWKSCKLNSSLSSAQSILCKPYKTVLKGVDLSHFFAMTDHFRLLLRAKHHFIGKRKFILRNFYGFSPFAPITQTTRITQQFQ